MYVGTCPLSGVLGLESVQDEGEQLHGRVEAAQVAEETLHAFPHRVMSYVVA